MALITIDRKAPATVQQQVAEQIRYLIARGHFPVGSVLPSTRRLGAELGVSFHTIRMAYSRLEQTGIVRAVPGRGFEVLPLEGGTDSDKMEIGALVIRAAVQRLIGIGLSESDIDYIFEEQFATLSGEPVAPRVIFVGSYREQAEECVQQLARLRIGNVGPVSVESLAATEAPDYAVCPFPLLRTVRARLHRAEVIGVDVVIGHEALDLVAPLLPQETLALVTRYPDAIAPLSRELRVRTGFPGQLLAGSVHQGKEHIHQIVAAADAILYSPAARTSIAGIAADRRTAPVHASVADSSLHVVQGAVVRG